MTCSPDKLRFSLALGVLLWLSATTAATPLLDLRVGSHKRFDRVVFEFEREVPHRMQLRDDNTVEIHFPNVSLPPDFRVPLFPHGLLVLKTIAVTKADPDETVFAIELSREAAASNLTLAGKPWRLAVDFAPRVSEKPEQKPEYIPGDRPIPTKFAATEPSLPDSLDSLRLHAVLAYYYQAIGDTARANREAALYHQLTGKTIALGPEPLPAEQKPAPRTTPAPTPRTPLSLPLPALLALAFAVGLGAGFLLLRIHLRLPALRLPRPHFRLRKRDLCTELAQDLAALDEAVKQEPARIPDAVSPVEPMELAPELVPDTEQEIRESLMDRRVRRVLELSREGRSIADIAEELQMGQDEVRLIIDLNQ